MRNGLSTIAVILVLSLVSCGKPNQDIAREPSDTYASPFVVIVDDVISGQVLGNSLNNPTGLAADFNGNIYVVDAGNNRVVRFTADLKPDRVLYGHPLPGCPELFHD